MSKTIVITRPPGEGDALTEALHARGHHILHEPLTHIYFRHTAQSTLASALRRNPDAIIVTSRHGALALATFTPMRDMALICVGETTYQTATSAGFTRVSMAGGTVESLLEYVLSAYDEGAALLYISAERVRLDLSVVLEKQGMITERIVLYEAIAAEHFSDTFAEHLKRGHVNAVTFLSQRAAEVFLQLTANAHLEHCLSALSAYCLSQTIAQTLDPAAWAAIHVAQTPTLTSLIDCIDNTA